MKGGGRECNEKEKQVKEKGNKNNNHSCVQREPSFMSSITLPSIKAYLSIIFSSLETIRQQQPYPRANIPETITTTLYGHGDNAYLCIWVCTKLEIIQQLEQTIAQLFTVAFFFCSKLEIEVQRSHNHNHNRDFVSYTTELCTNTK